MGTRWTAYVVDLATARDAAGEMGLSRTPLALVAVVARMDPTGQHLEYVARVPPNTDACRNRGLGRFHFYCCYRE